MIGVSFVIPVRNGRSTIRRALESVLAQSDGRPMEVIVVDDGSTDGSWELLTSLARHWPLRVLRADGHGAAAALNRGIRQARFPAICQVDQDVLLEPGWMARVTEELRDPSVGAAQGWYQTDIRAGVFARVMGRDLEDRYGVIGDVVDHACTGNSAYRAEALHRVGLFDESLGYGYDNDMSYRLGAAGYRIVHRRDARSLHGWREGLAGYLRQQYGFGYGRLDLVAKYPGRVAGDAVSPLTMMAHPIVMALAMLSAGAALTAPETLRVAFLISSAVLISLLVVERSVRGVRAAWRFRDLTPLLFPLVHLLRDVVWVAAIAIWFARRLAGIPARPSDSMWARTSRRSLPMRELRKEKPIDSGKVLAVIPAHNEAFNLPIVVDEIRSFSRAIDVLVVDDGSTDETATIVPLLGVTWLELPHRMGIGAAMRVALRYALTHGYGAVVRLDGDGQHLPTDMSRLLAPLAAGDADVAIGARASRSDEGKFGQWLRRGLATGLTAVTGRQVTDPTCGFYALGPRAIRILAEHHPTGYPEAELRLFLNRNRLRMLEVPVAARMRLSGQTSLTPARLILAAARVLLAMCVVPFRRAVPDLAHD